MCHYLAYLIAKIKHRNRPGNTLVKPSQYMGLAKVIHWSRLGSTLV